MAELAVITPVDGLAVIQNLKYQWAYTSKFRRDSYKDYFKNQSDIGHYVIVCPDEKLPTGYLIHLLEDVGAREVILPYVVNDCNETHSLISETLMTIAVQRDLFGISRSLRLHFMVIPQGNTVAVWSKCLRRIILSYFNIRVTYPKAFPFAPVIGVFNRFLSRLTPDDQDFISSVLEQYKKEFKIEIHLLDWIGAIDPIRKFNFRSVSTVSPFTMATNIFSNQVPNNFLDRKLSIREKETASFYVRRFVNRADGKVT